MAFCHAKNRVIKPNSLTNYIVFPRPIFYLAKKGKPLPKSNRKIDKLIAFGKWEIEPIFAMVALQQYLEELDILQLNLSEAEKVEYAKRREQLAPTIWNSGQRVGQGFSFLQETDIPENSIAHIRMDGVMRMQDGLSSRGIRQTTSELKQADTNPSIKAIIFEINSGGGEVMAGSFLQNAVSETKKPVYVWGHTIASAAYKGAIPAEKIFLSGQDAEAGSIGSMVTIDRRIVQYFAENQIEIYSNTSGNKNKEWRALLKGNTDPILQSITTRNDAFLDAVKQYRNLTGEKEQIEDTLSGHLFLAKEAHSRGLIDGVATFEQVLDRLTSEFEPKENINFSYSSISQNTNKMDKSVLQRISEAVNKAFGIQTQVKEGSIEQAAEELANQIETLSLEDWKKDMITQVTASVVSELQEQEKQSHGEFLKAQKAANTQVEIMQTAIEGLESEILALKGKEGKQEKNEGAPDKKQFKTITNLDTILVPEGTTSKY